MNIERQLKKANGAVRRKVLVLFCNKDEDVFWKGTTDGDGRFLIPNVDINYPTGTYHLKYYGDGIQPTIFKGDEIRKEDPVTPWEYNISIFSPSNETVVKGLLVFSDAEVYS